MQDARRDQPAGSRLESIGFGEIQNAVISLVPGGQALAKLVLGRPRFEAHEGVGEVVAGPVELGREVVAFRLPLATQEGGLLGGLVHVVGDWPEVVEELRVDRPLAVLVVDGRPDQLGAVGSDGVAQGELAAVGLDDVAEPLVVGSPLVGGNGTGGEPALVDAPSVGSQGVEVLPGQLHPGAGHQE